MSAIIAGTEGITKDPAGLEDDFGIISRGLVGGRSVKVPLGEAVNTFGLLVVVHIMRREGMEMEDIVVWQEFVCECMEEEELLWISINQSIIQSDDNNDSALVPFHRFTMFSY